MGEMKIAVNKSFYVEEMCFFCDDGGFE